MIEQTFGPRRCRDTRKPLAAQCPDTAFYRCPVCGSVFCVTGAEAKSGAEGGPGHADGGPQLSCCGASMERLIPASSGEGGPITYQIVGGYNDNAVRVSWSTGSKECAPQWIYLKTFTGGCLKYVPAGRRPPLVFALADTDAFAYCDADPCLECVFRCKRGVVLYAYFPDTGLWELPLDKMTAQWQSKAP